MDSTGRGANHRDRADRTAHRSERAGARRADASERSALLKQVAATGGLGLALLVAASARAQTMEPASLPPDRVGQAMAFGDFNGDGLLDLAVTARSQPSSERPESGAVLVFNGSQGGLLP